MPAEPHPTSGNRLALVDDLVRLFGRAFETDQLASADFKPGDEVAAGSGHHERN